MKVASTLQRTILYKKSYSDLVKFIESHPAFEVLTVDEEFWQEKTFLDFKVPKWYFNLTSGLLSPSQNYLYFLTQNTLIPESDQVLDLNECFCRAAQMGDLKMTESFLNELKERGVPPNYDKALIDATTGGNMSIIKKLEEISDYRFYNLLIYSCKSGNIEVVRHIYQTVCDENPKNVPNDIIQTSLLKSLEHSYEFYLEVCEVTGHKISSPLSNNFTNAIKTESMETFWILLPLMRNYEKIKSSLIGALISGNSELIEKMTKFRISPLFFEACQRRAYIYSGNVEEYAKLAKDTQISEEGLISDIEFALLQKCYSIIAWIFTNKKFTKGLTGEMEKLFERVTEAGDAGLVLHISSLCKDEEIQWTYSHQALETIYSGSFPLIKLFAQKVAKQLPLYEMADPQHYVISSQLFENNRLK